MRKDRSFSQMREISFEKDVNILTHTHINLLPHEHFNTKIYRFLPIQYMYIYIKFFFFLKKSDFLDKNSTIISIFISVKN